MREMKASGISWLGELPSNWELRKIKYCLQERVEKNNPVRTTEILSLTLNKASFHTIKKKVEETNLKRM